MVHLIDLTDFNCEKRIIVGLFQGTKGNAVEENEKISIVDARKVINLLHVKLAAVKTLLTVKKLTRSVSEEFKFHLSPTNSIPESMKLYGDIDGPVYIVCFCQEMTVDQFKDYCLARYSEELPDMSPDSDTIHKIYNASTEEGCLCNVACKGL